jgi:uncharacterized protein YfaS (alpha-2-macroglobulin family)
MSTSETKQLVKDDKNAFLSVHLTLLKLVLLAVLSISLTKPTGSVSGHIALQQKGFHLYSYDMKQNRVYALAQGPRGDESIERGVWVQPDGTFRIDQLPVGEYSLKVHAQGYSTVHESGVFIDDGKVTDFPDMIKMSVLSPSVSVASNTRVFTSKEKPSFWMSASGGTHAKVNLYRKDFLSLFKNKKDWTADQLDLSSELQIYHAAEEVLDFISTGQPVQSFTRELHLDDNDSARVDFKLDKPLPAGDYFAVAELANVEGKTDRNFMWFSVTDIGLVIKQGPDRTLVRAVDFDTLKPRAGVDVQLYFLTAAKIGKSLTSGKTGADGFVSLASPQGVSSQNLITVGTQGAEHAYGASWYYSNDNAKYTSYFYTDRPIYRLGQTVCFKSIIRHSEPGGYKTPREGLKVLAVAEDPDNNKLWEKQLRTNDHGTVNGTVDLPEEGKTGAYQITFTFPDGTKDYERFEVNQYRKPEYKVEVSPVQPRVVAGSKVKARVKATYYFGAPVRDARVKYSVYSSTDWSSRYRLMSRPSFYSYFDDWGDEDSSDSGYYYDSYGGSYVTQGYVQTDENGEAIVEFDSNPIERSSSHPFGSQYRDMRYKVEAEVTDISRMSVVSSGYCSVTAGDFALFVQPQNYVCRAGEPISVDFNAVDYDRKPVANQKVTVRLVRWPYDRVEHSYKPQELEQEFTVSTDQSGQGRVSFRTKNALPTDTYYVTAEASDKGGHVVYDEGSIWIANSSSPYILSQEDAQQEPLQVKLDKTIFKPGDTAKVMVSGPFSGSEGAEAIVSIEGQRIYNYKIVPMTSTAQLIEVPIKAEYEPNVFVSVAVVGPKRQFLTQSKIIKVSPQEHFLALAVTTDKAKYRPGENVTYTIHATFPDGKPAPNTELSLGVVDESIYAIRPEVAQDIQRFFYSRSSNNVTTLCSFPEQYSGGPDKTEPRVRKDFRDTAAWLPNLKTDSDGVAVATIRLPDNLTTWRATVRGINLAVDVGSTINKIICTQDLILRLALPRFFTEGDVGVVSAVVQNYTDKAQTIKISLEPPAQFQISNPLVLDRQVAAEKSERIDWPVKIIASGQAKIFCKAVGQTAGDAIERKIPVRSLGLPAFSARAGVLRDNPDQVSLPVGLSQDAAPETAKYQLSLAGSSIGPVLGNFSKLIDYPYGCTEQTMSRLMPSVVAMRLNQALGVPLSPGMKEVFRKVYEKSMKKLDGYQHSDGGWGWWENDDSNIYLTAHVLEGYYLLRQCGYEIDPARTKKALEWLAKSLPGLHKQLSDPKLVHDHYGDLEVYIDIAKAVNSMTLFGHKPTDAVTKFLVSKQLSLTPEALSYLTVAYARTGQRDYASQFYQRLVSIGNVNDNLMDWDHRESLLKLFGPPADNKRWLSQGDYTYRFTGTETTALALRAVLVMDPNNHDRLESIKTWLLLQRDRDGWDNTKTTAQVFISLLEEELVARKQSPPDFALAASLAQTALANLNFNSSNIYQPEQTFSVPVSLTSANLDLKKTGPGRLYYNSMVTYMRHLKPGDRVAEKSIPSGIAMGRQFFRLEPDVVSADGSIHYSTHQIKDHTIHAGETVLMKVTLNSPIALPYVIVEAALPSGAEVVDNDPRRNMVSGESSDDSGVSGDWGQWWWTHQDVLDDKIVFFVTSLPAGQHEFWTMVRLEMPGTFQINPMSMQGMYTKKVRAYSQLDYLKVVE